MTGLFRDGPVSEKAELPGLLNSHIRCNFTGGKTLAPDRKPLQGSGASEDDSGQNEQREDRAPLFALLLHRHVPQPSELIFFVPMLAAPLDRGSLRNAKVSLTRVLDFDGTLSEQGRMSPNQNRHPFIRRLRLPPSAKCPVELNETLILVAPGLR
jgi:hypothetical protein